MHLIAYLVGILGAVVFEAAEWVSRAKGNRWRDFIQMNSGRVVSHGIAALIMFPVWDAGWMLMVGHAAWVKAIGAIGITGASDSPGTVTSGTSVIAGFLLDIVAIFAVLIVRNLALRRARWLEKRWSPPEEDDHEFPGEPPPGP